MNRQYVQDIVNGLTKTVGLDKQRVSIALAIAIGYSLDVPKERIEMATEWYDQQYRWKVQQFVAEFNERYLIDVHLVISGAKEIWLARYSALYIQGQQQVVDLLTGKSTATRFITEYDYSEQDAAVIGQASVLITDKIIPVINEMTNPNATVK